MVKRDMTMPKLSIIDSLRQRWNARAQERWIESCKDFLGFKRSALAKETNIASLCSASSEIILNGLPRKQIHFSNRRIAPSVLHRKARFFCLL
jgi:hypothetical protein